MDKRLEPVAFTAPVIFKGPAPESDGTRTFSGIAYAGGIITDHPLIERVAFDLDSTKLSTPAPALYGHHTPVGVISAAAIDRNIEISGHLFKDVAGPSKDVVTMAEQGMPWQLSVGIWPGRIEEVKAGSKVSLNGRTFDGPLTVFRDNRVREVSFCALGADDQTRATVFAAVSEGGSRPPISTPGGVQMDQAEHDRIVADLQAQLTAEHGKTKDLGDRLAAFEAKAASAARDARLAAVKELFKATGREFADATAAPYLAMDEMTFTAVAADLKAKPTHDPKLFQQQATDGAGDTGGTAKDAGTIQREAQAFMVEFKAKYGRDLSIPDAVAHVTGKRTIQ